VTKMSYRRDISGCVLCEARVTITTCARCDSPLCAEHTPLSDQRCEGCEGDWMENAEPRPTIGRALLVGLIGAWCVVAFVMANGTYIAALRWVGGAAFAGLSVAFVLATQWTNLSVRHRRLQFLRGRIAGPRRRLLASADRAPKGLPAKGMPRRRPHLVGGGRSRWKLQTLSR
jgi:hypothetical protein